MIEVISFIATAFVLALGAGLLVANVYYYLWLSPPDDDNEYLH